MTIKLLELHVCLRNRLETSAGPPAPYRRRSTFTTIRLGEQCWLEKQWKQHLVPPPSGVKAVASIQWEGAKVKILIPAGRLTAAEESQRLEVKGWSSLLWLVCCWKIHLKRSIHHVGDAVGPALIGSGLMLPTCDHSNGLTCFKKKFKMHVIRLLPALVE